MKRPNKRSVLEGDSDEDDQPNTYDYTDSFIDDEQEGGMCVVEVTGRDGECVVEGTGRDGSVWWRLLVGMGSVWWRVLVGMGVCGGGYW